MIPLRQGSGGQAVLTEAELDRAVLFSIETAERALSTERLYDILARAGALPEEPLARLYPSHPHRLAICQSIERLKRSGALERWGLPWQAPGGAAEGTAS
ncbi:hypothetical protein FRZ44_38230 [Hypericibacter terrae]|uniref:Uncharacterized protein n=1 Tax=Hypericibacter terrae TaxID=2602015 RepID=A0A5J6MUK3_9PROT|nr:hypothetical protein [Hypericibacter terrae]QEX18516.1 hypothetical protein FRZ44_38230 [Hypericibacter terrae]